MNLFGFFEKEKPAGWKPKTARDFAGFPVQWEYRALNSPMEDDRIMFDGRPAHAWWCELESLRRQAPEQEKAWQRLWDGFRMLRIAEWVASHDCNTFDVLLRFKPMIDPAVDENDIGKQIVVEPLIRR